MKSGTGVGGGGGIKGSREARGGEEGRRKGVSTETVTKGGERSVREKTELSERSQNHLGD